MFIGNNPNVYETGKLINKLWYTMKFYSAIKEHTTDITI